MIILTIPGDREYLGRGDSANKGVSAEKVLYRRRTVDCQGKKDFKADCRYSPCLFCAHWRKGNTILATSLGNKKQKEGT